MKLKTILFPTDFSGSAKGALRQAVALATAQEARLHVFHALLLHMEGISNVEIALQDYAARAEAEAEEQLAEQSGELRDKGVQVDVSMTRSVSPFEAILDKATEIEADLIVMGTHGRTGLGKLVLGSVAEKVLRYASCPVMTLREDASVAESHNGFDRILAPVDFTDYSRRAVDVAKSLISQNGSLILNHVVSSPVHPSFYASGITSLFELDPELSGRIKKNLQSWLGEQAGEIIVTEGDVYSDILKARKDSEAELIVLGTRGLSGLDHFLMGSVTEKVVRSAKVPVLIVK